MAISFLWMKAFPSYGELVAEPVKPLCKESLDPQPDQKQQDILVSEEAWFKPLGLTVITTSVVGAYPGTGVCRILKDKEGVTYGIHGKQGLAELIRKLGWRDVKKIPNDMMVRLVHYAQFDGLLALETDLSPQVSRKDNELVVTMYSRRIPSKEIEKVVVTIQKTGEAVITRSPTKK